MIRQVFSIILFIVAGFFFFGVIEFGFVSECTPAEKTLLLGIFAILGILFLCGGLALKGFRGWRRNAGIVLISTAGFSALGVLSFVCLYFTEEFRAMMDPRVWNLFSDYAVGTLLIVGFALAGLYLLMVDREGVAKEPRGN